MTDRDPRHRGGTPGSTGPAIYTADTPPVESGEMTKALYRALDLLKGGLLKQSAWWSSMHITYEEPHVERLWTQVQDLRIYLHRLKPCTTTPLFHPHPWPSAMMIIQGMYEMRVGYGVGAHPPEEAARFVLVPKAIYEMGHPNSWHSVRPLRDVVYSVMITGKPWAKPVDMPTEVIKHGVLDEATVKSMLLYFESQASKGGLNPL